MATQTQTEYLAEPSGAHGEAKSRSVVTINNTADTTSPNVVIELGRIRSRQVDAAESLSRDDLGGLSEEQGSPARLLPQGVPPELPNLMAEIVFVLVCTAGQLIFSLTLGHITVNQFVFQKALGIVPSQIPWLVGSSSLASGLSVIVFGPLADLAPPKPLMIAAFLWEALWNAVSALVISPKLKIFFFVSRAMQGLAVGVLVSASMSILGRVYNPGMRKTRVFSMMAAGAPFGFWIGAMQGGALSSHLPWIFGSTSLFLCACAGAAYFTIPPLVPARDSNSMDVPSIKHFDYIGATLASLGSGLILFGLTQGSSVQWNPYTYSLVIVGCLMLLAFYLSAPYVKRPLVPHGIWKIPGFVPVLLAYIFGFGGYAGAWQFYAIQFWIRYQGASPLTVALYLLPNALVGVAAVWLVSRTLHVLPGHWILATSMVFFGIGNVFFLPQQPSTSYWALSMPAVALASLGPDMSFAAATIFITSSVPRSYQGSAGSLLVTVQNLTLAIMTSVSDSIGIKVDQLPSGEIGLEGMRAIWWFGLALSLVAALIAATMVRIPKAEEKEHVHNLVFLEGLIERLDYLQNYKPRIEFERSTLDPENRILIISPKFFGETVLDVILAQAIYGRDEMRKHCWFRLVYSTHVARLDSFLKEMIHELRQMQIEFYGEGSPAHIHTTIEDNGRIWTPTMSVTGDNVLEDIFASLNKQKEETIAIGKKHEAELFQQREEKIKLDDKHEAELRERFDTIDERYPGLSGVLCGVQHSFRDRADRSAERKALLEATMDYIERIRP